LSVRWRDIHRSWSSSRRGRDDVRRGGEFERLVFDEFAFLFLRSGRVAALKRGARGLLGSDMCGTREGRKGEGARSEAKPEWKEKTTTTH